MSLPLPVVPNGFWGGIRMNMDGANILNTFGFLQVGAGSTPATVAAAIASAMATAWPTRMNATFPTSLHYSEAFMYPLGDPTLPAAVATMTGGGNAGATQAPDQVCALVTHVTGVRGRGRNGRTYLVVPTSSDIQSDGKTLSGSYVTAVGTALSNFLSDVAASVNGSTTAVIEPAILSRTHAAMNPIVFSTTQTIIATQRRRLIR